MFGYLVRSLLQAVLVMLAVAFIAFAMFRYVGDPVASIVGQDATLKDREELATSLGLNDPLPVQYFRFVTNAVQGDFGISYRQGRQVSQLLRERLPATLELALLSGILALAVGIPLGIYTALKRDGTLANLVMSFSLIGVSLPTFLIGIGLIHLFGVYLRWLPTFGRGETVALGWWTTGLLTDTGRRSLILPVITLAFFQLTLIMRLVRSEMLEVMRTEYVRFARARGIEDRAIHFRHALRNTMVPVVTIAGMQMGAIVAFALVTETVFNWPGLGALFVKSVEVVDIPVMAAYLMFVGLVFVVVNLIVDTLYALIDPRLGRRGKGGDT
jgi:peptide/nickel transport system permease protein